LQNEGSGSFISVTVIGNWCKNWTMIVFFIFSPQFLEVYKQAKYETEEVDFKVY